MLDSVPAVDAGISPNAFGKKKQRSEWNGIPFSAPNAPFLCENPLTEAAPQSHLDSFMRRIVSNPSGPKHMPVQELIIS